MKHKVLAAKLRKSRFHTYPSGSTARSQAVAMIQDLQTVLASVRDGEDVPPWVIMKLSESASSVNSVSNYLSYHSKRNL